MILLGTGGAILLALAALLLLAGAVAIATVLSRLGLRVPVVNWDIGAAIGNAIAGAVSRAADWLWAGVRPAMEFLAAPFVMGITLGRDAAHAIEETVGALQRVAHAVGVAEQVAATDLDHVAGELVQGVQATEHRVDSYIQAVQADLTHGIDSVADQVVQGVQATEHRVDSYIQAVQAGLGDAIGDTRTWAAQAIDTVRDDLTREIEASRGYAEDVAAAAEAVVGAYLTTTIAPAIVAVTTEVDDCLEPNCEQLRTLGKAFSGLTTLITLGVVAAFVAAAVEDPTAMAAGMAGVAAPIEDTVEAVVRAVAHL